MLNPFKKLIRAVNERGWNGMVKQLYMIGDLRFGTLKGEDAFGNRYFEDLDAPYGQHRWVEYADIHNFDSSMIQPEWHGWMHHMYDETPGEEKPFTYTQLTPVSNAVYKHHVGLSELPPTAMINKSTFRQRGYKVGSLYTGPNDKDEYYMQPGHQFSPVSEKGGRYQHRKNNAKDIHDFYEKMAEIEVQRSKEEK